MKFLAVIPARYASTRFPGKPLVDLGGKSMIERVYRQAAEEFDNLYVATDHPKIYESVTSFGGRAVLTSTSHTNGTSRVAEAVEKIEKLRGSTAQYVINIQGDEPFIEPQQLKELSSIFQDPNREIATLVKRIESNEELFNPAVVKVVLSQEGEALYFSRAALPFQRDTKREEWLKEHTYYRHVGLYGFKRGALFEMVSLPEGRLERVEMLEQLRWLEAGAKIWTKETKHPSFAIDTPEDVDKLRSLGLF